MHKNVYLSLGSNLADRAANLRTALAQLSGLGQAVAVSPGAKTKNINVYDPDGVRIELNEYGPESLPKKSVDSWQ